MSCQNRQTFLYFAIMASSKTEMQARLMQLLAEDRGDGSFVNDMDETLSDLENKLYSHIDSWYGSNKKEICEKIKHVISVHLEADEEELDLLSEEFGHIFDVYTSSPSPWVAYSEQTWTRKGEILDESDGTGFVSSMRSYLETG